MVLATSPEVAWAKRTVVGYIKDTADQPVPGLLVKAWDDDADLPGGGKDDDFMGQDTTDARGYYSISYEGGHWDPFPHNITKWRPDIYIQVFAKTATGDWAKVINKSKVYRDQRLDDNLRIDAKVPPNQWVSRKTQFNPFWHGWPFVNMPKTVCAAPTCKDEHSFWGHLKSVTTFDWALCGGMSLSSLRRFRNGVAPTDFSPQVKEELVKAQLDTVGPNVWAKFIEWQAKPTNPCTLCAHTIGASTEGEWPKVYRAIDAGAPIILGLIRVKADNLGGLDPIEAAQLAAENHQVLAIGYEYNNLTKDAEISVYDPNYPYGISTITMNLGLPNNQIKASQKTRYLCRNASLSAPTFCPESDPEIDPLRGFFVIGDGSGPPIGAVIQPAPTQLAAYEAFEAFLESPTSKTIMMRTVGESDSGRLEADSLPRDCSTLGCQRDSEDPKEASPKSETMEPVATPTKKADTSPGEKN
jgi:hypothetical protein